MEANNESKKERRRLQKLQAMGATVESGLSHTMMSKIMRETESPAPRELTPEALQKAERLWPYMELLKFGPLKTKKAFLDHMVNLLIPETEIFMWESFVMSIIDACTILDHIDASCKDLGQLLLSVEHIETPKMDSLEYAAVVELLRKRSRGFLLKLCSDVFGFYSRFDYAVGGFFVPAALVSATRVDGRREDEKVEMDKLVHARLGEAFGARCAGCQNTSHDCKKCGQCEKVYYCSKKCQRKNWPAHKVQCKSAKEGTGSSSGGVLDQQREGGVTC